MSLGSFQTHTPGNIALVAEFGCDTVADVIPRLERAGILVLLLVEDFEKCDHVTRNFPQVIPIAFDPKDKADRTLAVLPKIDYIINYAGDDYMAAFKKTFNYFKKTDIEKSDSNSLFKKISEAGAKQTIFNIHDKTVVDIIKSSLRSPRENSPIRQIQSTFGNLNQRLRKSLRLKRSKSYSHGTQTTSKSHDPAASTENISPKSHSSRYSRNKNSRDVSTEAPPRKNASILRKLFASSSQSSPPCSALNEKYRKFSKNMHKFHEERSNKWKNEIQRIQQEEIKMQKNLSKTVATEQSIEKNNILQKTMEANSSTIQGLSEGTAKMVLASRENRADKEVRKNANKKLERGQREIEEKIIKLIQDSKIKYQSKIIEKQIAEIKRLRSKYCL